MSEGVRIEKIRAWQAIVIALLTLVGTLAGIFGKEAFFPSVSQEQVDSAIIAATDLPLGTIIVSMLPYEEFSNLNGFDSKFDQESSIWAPCDGRVIERSKLGSISRTPDMRGLFLRGANSMYNENIGAGPLSSDHLNPDETELGGYQSDAIIRHNHKYVAGTKEYTTKLTDNDRYLINPGEKETSNNENGQKETRPKNITVNYFIKIN